MKREYTREVEPFLTLSQPPGDGREAARQVVAVDRPEGDREDGGYGDVCNRRSVSNQTLVVVSEPRFQDVQDLADFFEAGVRRRWVGDSCGEALQQRCRQRPTCRRRSRVQSLVHALGSWAQGPA